MKFYYPIFLIFFLLLSCATPQKPSQNKKKEQLGIIHFKKGAQDLQEGDVATSIKNLRLAVEYEPNNSVYHNHLAFAYVKKKLFEDAERHFITAHKLAPKNSSIANNLASLYLQQKKYDSALGYYRKVLNDATYSARSLTYYNMGLLEQERNRDTEALKHFLSSIQENTSASSTCRSHYAIGKIRYNTGLFQQAVVSFKESILGDCYTIIHHRFYYALSLIKISKRATAKYVLRSILEEAPSSPYAKKSRILLNELDPNFLLYEK